MTDFHATAEQAIEAGNALAATLDRALAEVKRLRADNARLRAALKRIVDLDGSNAPDEEWDICISSARAALAKAGAT